MDGPDVVELPDPRGFQGDGKTPVEQPRKNDSGPGQHNVARLSQAWRNAGNVFVKHFVVILRTDAGDVGRNKYPETYVPTGEFGCHLRNQGHGNGNHRQGGAGRHGDLAHVDERILRWTAVVNHHVTQVGELLAAG